MWDPGNFSINTSDFINTSNTPFFIKKSNFNKTSNLKEIEYYYQLLDKAYEIINNYGPTEYTVVTTSFKIDKEYRNIPIGKLIANTRVYILNENNKIWGQAIYDIGYATGKCDHLYATTQFQGKVIFLKDLEEKKQSYSCFSVPNCVRIFILWPPPVK